MMFIECSLMRGGTSRGLMFLDKDLPMEEEKRFEIFLKLLREPDGQQKLGGDKSTNNKIGVVRKSQSPGIDGVDGIDINFKFYQVHPKSTLVDTLLNCGNFISAVPLFAIIKGLVTVDKTIIRILNENTGQIVEAKVDGEETAYTSSLLRFLNIGKDTLPTGRVIDVIDGIEVTIANIAVPMVIVDGKGLGIDLGIDSGTSLEVLKSDKLLRTLYSLRKKAIELMDIPSDYLNYSIPKVCIVVPSIKGTIKSYYYDPFALHDNYAVTGGICLASACVIEGTIANKICGKAGNKTAGNKIVIEHLGGTMEIELETNEKGQKSASIMRTASVLMDGKAYL